jgi:hypothetical protein
LIHSNKRDKLAASGGLRWIAVSCVLLALLLSGLEATHMHAGASSSSNPCAVCISAHANAPAVIFHPLPVVYAVDAVVIPLQTEGKSTSPELQLFIRPPPAA